MKKQIKGFNEFSKTASINESEDDLEFLGKIGAGVREEKRVDLMDLFDAYAKTMANKNFPVLIYTVADGPGRDIIMKGITVVSNPTEDEMQEIYDADEDGWSDYEWA